MATPGHHTLSVLVANRPGVLSRVSGLFSRRGFNIESLAVGPTERADRSVITIRVDCTKHSVDQVAKQLDKLIDAGSGTFVARLELPNANHAIPGGVRCTAQIEGISAPSTAVPKLLTSKP